MNLIGKIKLKVNKKQRKEFHFCVNIDKFSMKVNLN